MSIHEKPTSGYGFIYILSHPSMPNVYKVGLTTNSIKQRMKELHTTGVPKPFRVERIFEVQEEHLLRVERRAHEKLKSRNLHHGKEFFKGNLLHCEEAVEDSIYELTNEHSKDLIGLARERAANEKAARDAERTKREREAQLLQEKLARLARTNEEIKRQREHYKNKSIKQAWDVKPLLMKLILFFVLTEAYFTAIATFYGLGAFMALGILSPISMILTIRLLYDLKWSENTKLLNQFEELAIATFPYKTIDTLEDPGVHSSLIKANSLTAPPLATEPKAATKDYRREVLQQMLMSKRQEIIKEIEGSRGQALMDLDRELGIALMEMRNCRRQAIDEALTRLTEGTYGICEECGIEISERRLESIPFAKLCVECQSKKELPEKSSQKNITSN